MKEQNANVPNAATSLSHKPVLKLAWCDHNAALFAVKRWHYSKSMPAGKLVKIGVWEDGKFIGVVLFGRGANNHLGMAFGLTQLGCCELVRVALNTHATPVSRILAIALKMLKKQSPGMELVISYADCDENHHGGIYAASGWVYLGKVQTGGGTPKYRIRGEVVHGKTVHSKYGRGSQNITWIRSHVDPRAELVYTLGKHKYAFPLNGAMKVKIAPMAKPYPKRERSADSGVSGPQPGRGGANPTRSLQVLPEV